MFAVNPILLRANALQNRSYILIVGNSGFTPANGVTSGTGTVTDPYINSQPYSYHDVNTYARQSVFQTGPSP